MRQQTTKQIEPYNRREISDIYLAPSNHHICGGDGFFYNNIGFILSVYTRFNKPEKINTNAKLNVYNP